MLGAVLAPTDPVLASDVQVEGPGVGSGDEVRFSLSGEAGLNDALAFPFVWLAVLVADHGVAPDTWIGRWLLVDVLWRVGVGVGLVVGVVVGRALGWLAYQVPALKGRPTVTTGQLQSQFIHTLVKSPARAASGCT